MQREYVQAYQEKHQSRSQCMSLIMGKPLRPQTFGIHPRLHHIRKAHNCKPLEKRIKFDVDRIEWQYAVYAFEIDDFRQDAQIVASGQKYLTRKVIRLSLEPGNEIKHYVMDMFTMLMNKRITVEEALGGFTHIYRSHVGFIISQVARGSLPCGILNGLQERIMEEFSDNSFVKDVYMYIIPTLIGGSWIAHILDIESGELHVVDIELEVRKRVSRDYTEHVRKCMEMALDYFDRQRLVRKYVAHKVLYFVMADALMVRSHNRPYGCISDNSMLMLRYLEVFDDYSTWTAVPAEEANLYRVHALANMLLSPFNDKKIINDLVFKGMRGAVA